VNRGGGDVGRVPVKSERAACFLGWGRGVEGRGGGSPISGKL